jgi:hypothetical protein
MNMIIQVWKKNPTTHQKQKLMDPAVMARLWCDTFNHEKFSLFPAK